MAKLTEFNATYAIRRTFIVAILYAEFLHMFITNVGGGSCVVSTWLPRLGKCRQIAFSIARFLDLGSGVTQARGRGVDRGRASGVKGVGLEMGELE